jgi:hypothetical protein
MAHPEEQDLLTRNDLMPGQPGHRDIEIAGAQRSQQEERCGAGAETDAHIGQAQRLHFDPCYQYEKDSDQQGKMRECQGKYWSWLKSIPADPG